MSEIRIDNIVNLESVLRDQVTKFEHLREKVKRLKFERIDPAGNYAAISYKAIDGGMMNIKLNPIEADIIEIADSNNNVKMQFCIGEPASEESIEQNISNLDSIPEIKSFLDCLHLNTIKDTSEILTDRGTYMEIAEWACIFDKINKTTDDKLIIMRDGLLRSKKLKSEFFPELIKILKDKKNNVKLVGVSKTSKVLSLLSFVLYAEKVFPSDAIGYVKIPLELELEAYKWSGAGKIKEDKIEPLNFAFGELYIAKLSRKSNLLVTIEVPKDLKNNRDIYTKDEVELIFGHLSKDSEYSYPDVGYPQTIMLAHETAVRTGFPADLIKDLILEKFMNNLDEKTRNAMKEYKIMESFVDKGVLGGGAQ